MLEENKETMSIVLLRNMQIIHRTPESLIKLKCSEKKKFLFLFEGFGSKTRKLTKLDLLICLYNLKLLYYFSY